MTHATVLLIHGGAGTIHPDRLSTTLRQTILLGLRTALSAGQRLLVQGAPALDAVVAAVSALEDDPLFNAGRGAVFTSAGSHEMDAAVMDGATQRVGAVACVLGPRNPVQAARIVMERSPHVFLAGTGALAFLRDQGVPMESSDYFSTPERLEALRAILQSGPDSAEADDFDRHGTVGAVALDQDGNLAAATSTGGMTAKQPGRIGDTPIFGAGTWADPSCAMSATGHGESFIRVAAAHQLSALIRLAGQNLSDAAATVLRSVEAVGGTGGLIALDHHGNMALPFNTRGMYRGYALGAGAPKVAIHREALA